MIYNKQVFPKESVSNPEGPIEVSKDSMNILIILFAQVKWRLIIAFTYLKLMNKYSRTSYIELEGYSKKKIDIYVL